MSTTRPRRVLPDRVRVVLCAVASLGDLTGQGIVREHRRLRAAGADAAALARLAATAQLASFVACVAALVTALVAVGGALPGVFIWTAVLVPVSFTAATVVLAVDDRARR